jgi:hypothetical protein
MEVPHRNAVHKAVALGMLACRVKGRAICTQEYDDVPITKLMEELLECSEGHCQGCSYYDRDPLTK